ncbi:DUF6174 domain-containing protein [Nocardioides speluncae]|uniref:DUF6174 domain-containing protein n=1 Tax=Nocardioides speluncae TaxID=2670337 RepID=UPI000D6877E1|nr:DUF6174 domain-containing protein [Nocardioides speluncae]
MNLRRLAIIVSLFVALLMSTAYAATSAAPAAPATSASDDRPTAAAGVPRKVVPFVIEAGDSEKLRRAWRKWRSLREHRYVTYTELTCFCPTQPRVKTKIRPIGGRDHVVSVTHVGWPDQQVQENGYPVQWFYRLWRRAERKADLYRLKFDKRGLLKHIYIDWDDRMADEEQTFRIVLVRQ